LKNNIHIVYFFTKIRILLFKNITIKVQFLFEVAKPFEVLFIFVVKLAFTIFNRNKKQNMPCFKE